MLNIFNISVVIVKYCNNFISNVKVFKKYAVTHAKYIKKGKGDTKMGLSASSARLILETARMNDVEFEGQQINQQRVILSNKVNETYNILAQLAVPTPPLTQDFTRTTYSFTIGTTNCSIQALRPSGQYFDMDVSYTAHGNNMVPGRMVQVTRSASEPPSYSVGDYRICSVYDAYHGNPQMITQDEYNGYIQAFRNMDPSLADPNTTHPDEIALKFSMYFPPLGGRSDITDRIFMRTADLTQMVEDTESVDTFEYTASGEYTAYQTYEDTDVIFDNNGNISQVGILVTDPNTGITTRTYYTVTTGTETDERAYNDALNKYEFDKYNYDKEMTRLNHQTSIYQRQDKQLELKLTRLDNERNAINTEIEAVKKVIQDDIDKSFKTFGG